MQAAQRINALAFEDGAGGKHAEAAPVLSRVYHHWTR